MTALWFLIALGAIVIAVLAIEADENQASRLHRPTGLVTWLTGGNWPAKVGGALVVVGLGALLRYALINIDVPPTLKLSGGITMALALGLAATLLPAGSSRRPVSLALGGAAFGVAYLTAYSAFGLFGYLSNPAGLGLLGVTSAAAGAYAVTRSALSLALLSMIGAYLAPAFAVTDPGPAIVYGYYVGASLLTLAMVALRGWHPLIHVSFVFTLAGGVFFAWTSQYYEVAHADVMLPMLLLLAAVHVTMPIVERAGSRAPWVERMDLAYTIALPATAALLCALIAPSRLDLSDALLGLCTIWACAAIGLLLVRREGIAAHAIVAGLLLVLGLAARFRDLPWELISLAMSVAGLAIAARGRRPVSRLHGILAGLVVLFGAIHILSSAATGDGGDAFLSGVFVERLLGAALLVIAGTICRRIRQPLDTLLLAMGIVWGVVAIGIQVVRWDVATLALVVHWVLLLIAASLWIPGRKIQVGDRNADGLSFAIMATAFWACTGTVSSAAAWSSLVAASIALVGLTVRPVWWANGFRSRLMASLMAPATAAIWAAAVGRASGIEEWQFALAAGAAVAILALAVARLVPGERTRWVERAVEIFAVAFVAVLALATLVDIARAASAVVLEFLCLTGLMLVARIRHERQLSIGPAVVACMVGGALILQANIMRVLGPPGSLDIGDILRLRWPAVISLVWAVAGSALTIWSRRIASRTVWVAGASLLVAAAVKLLVVDFGSLGRLANILAVIAAGAVFLLVGWLAPMPPARDADSAARPRRARNTDEPDDEPGERNVSWTTTAVLAVLALMLYFRVASQEVVRGVMKGPPERPAVAESVTEPTPESPSSEINRVTQADADTDPAAATLVDPQAPEGDLAVEETGVFDDAPARAPDEEAASAPQPWTPPPTVDANGERVFSQYSMPQSAASGENASDADTPPTPAPGAAGIDQLLRERRIRRATPTDVDRWIAATGNKKARSDLHLDIMDFRTGDQFVLATYVVLRPMTFPEGLYGAHSATFIVPRNVPRPYGDPGHSRVLEVP